MIKTDGLAAGKGVLVARTLDEARDDVTAKLSGAAFGDAGRHIVIEEGLVGEECSLLVLCDGTRAVPLVPAQDYKRIGDGDVGPNTGGMGAYAPMPQVGARDVERLLDAAVRPLVEELRRRGIDYRGVLYAGLMLTPDGPKVIEYNVRFGDPEAQVVLPLLACDAAELFLAVANGALDEADPPAFSGDAAVCVVMASQGYPEHPRTGDTIEGLLPSGQSVARVEGATVFHAGTGRHTPRRAVPHRRRARARRHRRRPDARRGARARLRRRGAHRLGGHADAVRHRGERARCDGTGAGGRRMIPRYAPADMAALFSDAARFSLWLEVELLATEAQAALGVVPADEAATCRAKAPVVDEVFVADVLEREKVTDHDVAAFVDVVQERIGAPAGSHIHYGLTSSDVVDTALCATLTRAADLLLEDLSAFVAALKARALELMHVPVTGRTHGMHAEPTTFGVKFALWALQADRDRRRLRAARDAVAVGKLSGAVGTYSNIDPAVESRVCAALGLTPVPATQVIARDRHAEYLAACASIGATIELMCTEIRHLARSELGEAEEPFGAGQKGCSAMPHKRNPILSERLCGLARLLRGYLGAGLEDVALWHERDISHSSVERVALPDASMLTCYMLRKATGLAAGLVIHRRPRPRQPHGRLARSRLLPVRAPGPGRRRPDARRGLPRRAA